MEVQEVVEVILEGVCMELWELFGLIFNKVEVSEDELVSKVQCRKEKRQRVKGNFMLLIGRNYWQLLECLQVWQSWLDELCGQDEGKVQELEVKMKWINFFYKVEGVKICDDECLLQEVLKCKEKCRVQWQCWWEKCMVGVVEKMQQCQDWWWQNLCRKKVVCVECCLFRVCKKGCILLQDLECVGLV